MSPSLPNEFQSPKNLPGFLHHHQCLNCEFCHWCHMPLFKVEELTEILMMNECITEPRSLAFHAKFHGWSELLVMSSLYILGRAGSFHSYQTLRHMSVVAVCLFYPHHFLNSFMEMKDDYISISKNINELSRVASHYNAIGHLGACGLMDMVHIK